MVKAKSNGPPSKGPIHLSSIPALFTHSRRNSSPKKVILTVELKKNIIEALINNVYAQCSPLSVNLSRPLDSQFRPS